MNKQNIVQKANLDVEKVYSLSLPYNVSKRERVINTISKQLNSKFVENAKIQTCYTAKNNKLKKKTCYTGKNNKLKKNLLHW